MSYEVTLTAAMRSNLLSLQQTATAMGNTQQRLATGKAVNSALDNPVNFFAASAHMERANDLAGRKDGMNEAIQTIQAGNTGITALQSLLGAAKGVMETARTTSTGGYAALYKQFNEIGSQIKQLITDSGYKGTNLLKGTSIALDVLFNETGSNKLTLNGFDAEVSALVGTANVGSVAGSNGGFSNMSAMTAISSFVAGTGVGSNVSGLSGAAFINGVENGLTAMIKTLSVQAAKMASNLNVINARLDFTNSMINVEKTGSDNLTLADTNQEGANMLMLQTRQQLGTTSLSLASQAAQSVLRLF
jgi:flagellin-like hook-associated protein FlgL